MNNIIIKPYVDDKGVQYETVIRSDALREYVNTVASAFPDWKFVGSAYRSDYLREKDENGVDKYIYYVKLFNVLGKNGDPLGDMYMQSWGSTPYVIDNERIRMLRERGSGMKSADIKKQIKNMKKYFTDLTLPEKISKHFNKGEWAVDGVHRQRARKVRRAVDTIGDYVQAQLKDDYDRVSPVLFMMLPEDKRDVMATIPEALEENEQALDLVLAYEKVEHPRRASFVMVENGKYYFVRKENKKDIHVREADDIRADVRQAIGMLKLLPDNLEAEDAYIPNKGVRVGKDLFVVYDDLDDLLVKEKEGE